MTEMIDDEFEAIVELDIRKAATEEQMNELAEDPESWRDALVSRLRHIESQFAEQRAKLSKKAFEDWAAPAVKYKSEVLERLTEAKAILKEQNQSRSQQSDRNFAIIAQELTTIRKLLEAKL